MLLCSSLLLPAHWSFLSTFATVLNIKENPNLLGIAGSLLHVFTHIYLAPFFHNQENINTELITKL